MNSPEPLILEALTHPLPDDVRQLAVDFLSGERGIDIERRAYERLDTINSRIVHHLCYAIAYHSGGYCSGSSKQETLDRLSRTLDSLKP